jgi:hypothetical protein
MILLIRMINNLTSKIIFEMYSNLARPLRWYP